MTKKELLNWLLADQSDENVDIVGPRPGPDKFKVLVDISVEKGYDKVIGSYKDYPFSKTSIAKDVIFLR